MRQFNAKQALPVERLWIGHWPKAGTALPPLVNARGLVMDTCLRRLLITNGRDAAASIAAPETFSGAAAYQFLLEVTTGLESAVPGETNVFGQFKRAWKSYCRVADGAAIEALGPFIAQAVRDTRDIRQRHLQNIGGASYGPLVRRLLRAADGERILFVGAGELARSILPFFRSFQVGIWNRRPPGPAFAAAGRLFTAADGASAADWAHHVVLTTPADASNDERWARWLGPSLVKTVLHLGRRRVEGRAWPAHLVGYDLDDVFELRRSQDNIRSLQLEHARHACRVTAQGIATAISPPARRLAAGRAG